MKRILVTGSRKWVDQDVIFAALQSHLGNEKEAIVVHGACPSGADKIAQAWVDLQPGIEGEPHPAEWERYGRAAGVIRNEEMVKLGADLCLAFPLGESFGTRDCMMKAKNTGIQVISYEGVTRDLFSA